MSATQDKTQKVTFVYSNLYQIYRKGKEAAQKAEIPAQSAAPLAVPATQSSSFAAVRSGVLKTEDLKTARVEAFQPAEFIQKRVVARPEYLAPKRPGQSEAIESLKQNLKSLNDLHSRLRFMLQELEDLVKE